MRAFPRLFSLAAIFCFTGAAGYADSLFLGCSASTTMTVTMASPTATGSFTCPQFNANLGTLTEAIIFLPERITFLSGSTFSIKNIGAAPIPAGVGSVFGVNLKFAVGPYPDGRIGPTGNAPVSAPPASIPVGSTVTFTAAPGNPAFFSPSYDIFNTTASLQALSGNGTFVLPLSVKSSDQTFNNYSTEQLADYSVSFYLNPARVLVSNNPIQEAGGVLFSFTSPALSTAPEPTGLSLVGAAAFALFGWKRRRGR